MVEELKLAIKIDDATIEQSLLKQFANAQKMADKVILDFKNVSFDDKQIEAKFKEMQKKAGQNPIDLTIGGNTLDMLGQIDKRLTEIFSIGKGKSFIDSSSIAADIGKIENKINELNKKYEESQKKLSSIGSGGISGKDVNLVDNKEFQKLSDNFEKIKGEIDELKQKINTINIDTEWLNNFTTGLDEELTDTQAKLDNFINDFNSSFEKINTSTSNTFFNEESIRIFEKLLTSIESSLSSIKGALVDIGDGEELSPLLKNINNIEVAVNRLSSSVKGIGLNMNIDLGSDKEMEAKVESKISNALQAYQRLFEHIKMSSTGGSIINTKFFDFDINQYDTAMSKLQAYKKFIENMRNEAKAMYGGQDVLFTDTDKKYWTQASSAMGQVTKTFNEMKAASDTNPLENIFGKTDLSGVIEQLNTIVSKLDEISVSAKGFVETFKNGLNVNASVEEIEKLTNRVKELEDELAEVKVPTALPSEESNILSGKKDAFPSTSDINNSDLSSLEDKIKSIFTDIKELEQILNSLNNGDYFTFDTSKNDDALGRVRELEKVLEEYGYKIKNFKDDSEAFNVSGAIVPSLEKENSSWDDNIKKVLEKQKLLRQNSPTTFIDETTQAIREENNALEETANKAKQAVSELVKSRDVVSQNWYREKGTVVGKDLKGNDITRDADEFSFVERLKNGQLQTVLATYNEETGKWAEQVINVRTAFEQVEKAIISADNKIASLEMTKEKTLAAHSGYDTTADDNQIATERKKRDELQNTLNLYGQEKEYVFEIEAANKRIADNQERLNNKKQAQTNLRQAVSDEKDAKANEQANKRDAKQAQIDAENVKLAEQKSIYNELIDSIERYFTVSKRIESDKAFEGDYEEVARLQEKIEELQNNPILSQEQLDASQRKLEKIETTLEDIVAAKEKSDSIKVDSENVKNIQSEWDKNIKAIQDYMDAMTKLNNLKAKDKGTGSEANQIALQIQNVEELKQTAWDARQNLSSIQAENPDIIAWKQWVDMMELFDQASKGSAESAAKLKDVLDNIKAPSLDKYENKLASYQTKKDTYDATIARFNDGGWTSDTYLKNVQAVKDAVKKYEDLLSDIKAKGGIASEEDIQNLKEYESKIKDTIATVTNMSASEKGYNFVSGQKELDKIHKLLNENSNMSAEAKAKIKSYYAEIESGNPSMSLDRIHGEIMKIYNAEVEAGRAGRSFFDTLKNSGFHQLAAQMAGMFGVYDVINGLKQVASTVRELDTAYTEMRKVSNESAQSLKNFQKESFSTADSVGTTALALQDATATWMRLGESLDEAKESAKDATVLLNVSEFENIDEATDSLVAMSQAYKELDKMEIIDVLDKIGNEYSISTNELSTALKDSAAVLKTQGNDLAESVALITAGNAITQDVSKTAGETLPERYRNIFYRTYLTARAA